MTEPRQVSDSGLQLQYEIWGQAPVQALGSIGGREFYFRARHSEWSFEVALEDGQLPSDVGASSVFYRAGQHGNAGYMAFDDCVAIISRLATEYLA